MVSLVDEIRGHTSDILFLRSISVRASFLLPLLLRFKGILTNLLSLDAD